MGAREQIQNSMVFLFCKFLKVSTSIFWLKAVVTLKYVFFTYFEHISGVSPEKAFYVQVIIIPGDIDPKQARKIFHKLHISLCNLSCARIIHYTSGILVKIMLLSQLFFHTPTHKALIELNVTDC